MSHDLYFPHSRRAGGDDEELGPWPAGPQEDYHYDLDLLETFLGRVSYCQRLAARQAGFPGLGWGWRRIMLARVGPIFDLGRFSDKVHKRAVIWFVFKKLEELRDQLEGAGQHNINFAEYTQIGWVARIMVSKSSGTMWKRDTEANHGYIRAVCEQCLRMAS